MSFYTPLRYPGGKRKLLVFFEALLQANELRGCSYVEPYAGGAGLALSLLFRSWVSHLYLNDINRGIYAFWFSILYLTDELCKKINDTPVSMEEWRRQKEIQQDAKDVDFLALGFSTFFLNRTNRSGIIKGGVIGGKGQSGDWKLDARYTKKDLIRRIQAISSKKDQIHLSQMDAVEYMRRLSCFPKQSVLFYLDPPYFEKGAELYNNFYRKEDHVGVANCITGSPHRWVVSYDNQEGIRALYKGYKAITYSLNYTAQDKKKGTEFMAFSHDLRLPDFPCDISEKYFSLMHNLKAIA